MMDYSKTYLNITYHPIMDNYKEFKNITNRNNDIQLSLQKWRENLSPLIYEGESNKIHSAHPRKN